MILTGSVSTWRLGADRSQEKRNSVDYTDNADFDSDLRSAKSNVSLRVHVKLVNIRGKMQFIFVVNKLSLLCSSHIKHS